jgi:hypothetical protein
MAWITLVLTAVPVLVLVLLIRRGALARRKCRESLAEYSDPLDPIDREIAKLQEQLDEFEHTGGSGTWMAFFANAYRQRRLADLRRHRRWHLKETRRWWLHRENPAAIRLPQSRGRAPGDIRRRGL